MAMLEGLEVGIRSGLEEGRRQADVLLERSWLVH